MKIAVVTNTGDIITQHFGRAKYYRVFTVEEGKIINDELREKFIPAGHHHHHHGHGSHEHPQHGMHDQNHEERHRKMLETIQDCDVVIVGGMGWSMYNALQQAGKTVIMTNEKKVLEAVQKFVNGTLEDLGEARLH